MSVGLEGGDIEVGSCRTNQNGAATGLIMICFFMPARSYPVFRLFGERGLFIYLACTELKGRSRISKEAAAIHYSILESSNVLNTAGPFCNSEQAISALCCSFFFSCAVH